MKTVNVSVYGIEKFLDAQDENGDPIDGRSRFSADENLTFEIDGKDYYASDFGEGDYDNKDFNGAGEIDAARFFEEAGARKGMLYTNKASCGFEIELSDDVEFDPKKVTLVCRDFIYPSGADEAMLVAFVYDGRAYDECYPQDSVGKGASLIWKAAAEDAIAYTDETASDEQLEDASKLPVLVFRYQALSYCYEPRDEFDADDYPELEGPGVVSAINDDDNGMMFICADPLEYINNGEMDEELVREDITDYEITLSATEKEYALLNCADNLGKDEILKNIAAVWEFSYEYSKHKPVFDKLVFRAIRRDTEDYARNEDYLLDSGKVYKLPEGKFDEIIANLSEEDQKLNKELTPFGEYE